jgi:hypothetical protein
MKILPCALIVFLLHANLSAAESTKAAPPVKSKIPQSGEYVFSLLPKSFQRNPILEMTVNTEVTEYGRMLRPASTDQPVYYVAAPVGYRQFGATVGEKAPSPQDLEAAMTKALADTGYLVAKQAGPNPSLVVVYYWGSHNKIDPELAADFPQLAAKHRLERAVLVGGKKYAAELGRTMEFGETIADRSLEKEYLRDQASGDLYFVVASAYDYVGVTRGEKKLAWRTTMTVNSAGVNMRETLPPLMATASEFFGRETLTPEIASRRVSREGKVEVGIPTVIEEKKTKP